jgi:hypothetical protein
MVEKTFVNEEKVVEASAVAAIRLYRYWRSNGDSEEEAARKAVKTAIGMLRAGGISPEKVVATLDDFAAVFRALWEAMI